MNESQINWVKQQEAKIEQQIKSKGIKNLTDDDWKEIMDFICKCIEKAKSSGIEVRKMLFDFIEKYDSEVNKR